MGIKSTEVSFPIRKVCRDFIQQLLSRVLVLTSWDLGWGGFI